MKAPIVLTTICPSSPGSAFFTYMPASHPTTFPMLIMIIMLYGSIDGVPVQLSRIDVEALSCLLIQSQTAAGPLSPLAARLDHAQQALERPGAEAEALQVAHRIG